MRQGRSLAEIATQLESQLHTRKDFLAPQGHIQARVAEQTFEAEKDYTGTPVEIKQGEVILDGLNGVPYAINNHAHGQLADHLGIPAKYYSRMAAEQPALLAANINTWLKAEPSEERLVRVLNGRVRGFLSKKYRPLDNFDLANAVLPTLLKHRVQILSAELTETRLYIKGILPDLSEPLPEGLVWGSGHTDITRVAPGLELPPEQVALFRPEGRGRIVSAIVISNSEVGAGTLRVEPSVFTTWCTNLAILVQAALKKYHVGRAWEVDSNFEVFADETRQKDDEAFFLKVRDVTAAAFSAEQFQAAIAQIRSAGQKQIESPALPKVVEVAVRQLALPVGTKDGILNFLTRGGDLSQWGLSSAITAVANSAESYELATQLEYAGGQVLALPDAQWNTIAKAA